MVFDSQDYFSFLVVTISDLKLVYGRLCDIDSGDVRKEYGVHRNVVEKCLKCDRRACFKYYVFLDAAVTSDGSKQHDSAYNCNNTQNNDSCEHSHLLLAQRCLGICLGICLCLGFRSRIGRDFSAVHQCNIVCCGSP